MELMKGRNRVMNLDIFGAGPIEARSTTTTTNLENGEGMVMEPILMAI